ncbi:hypothetical protein SLE2022_303730 [Rubroshorea leprosula]
MPTFTAIALDRLFEPGASKSVDKSGSKAKPPAPISTSKLEGRNGSSVAERKVSRPQITPALYATPESTPLPDSPSSFSPSPYIVNHKRRGPRLQKSFSAQDVSSQQKDLPEENVNGNVKQGDSNMCADSSKGDSVTFNIPTPIEKEHDNGIHDSPIKEEDANGGLLGSVQHVNSAHDGESASSNGRVRSSDVSNSFTMENVVRNLVPLNLNINGDSEDFFDPRESMSATSGNEAEDNSGAESFARIMTPNVEFFDAWEELSSESGQLSSSLHDTHAELREMRLSLLMEIDKRNQAEEALNNMQSKWQKLRQQLALVGVTLPVNPIDLAEDDLVDPAEELLGQMDTVRYVSYSVGRGIARTEMEVEMESQIEIKNFEIARLMDRLHYYEAVNREMSQRNQEAVEMARRDRHKMKRRQRWVWGSIATAITLGTAALVWSYLPTDKASPSPSSSSAPDDDDCAK